MRGCVLAQFLPRPRCHTARHRLLHHAAAHRSAPAPASEQEQVSYDTLSGGKVTLRQGALRGSYRYGLDALLLATDLPDVLSSDASPHVVDVRALRMLCAHARAH